MNQIFKNIKSILNKKQKITMSLLVLGALVQALVEAACVGLVPLFVVTLQNPSSISSAKLIMEFSRLIDTRLEGDALVYTMTAVLLGAYLIRSVYGVFFLVAQSRAIEKIHLELKMKVYQHHIYSSYINHLNISQQDFIKKIVNDLDLVCYGYINPAIQLCTEGLTLVLIAGLLIWVESVLTICVGLTFGMCSYAFYTAIKRKSSDYGMINKSMSTEAMKWINQSFAGIKEIKINQQERYFLAKYFEYAQASARSSNNNGILIGLPRYYNELLSILGIVAITAYCMYTFNAKSIVPILTFYVISVTRMLPSLNRIIASLSSLKYAESSIATVKEKFAYKNSDSIDLEKREKDNQIEIFNNLTVQNVKFKYVNSQFKININYFRIEKGQKIALVGKSGSGKSTFVDLMCGLLTPDKGEVLVNGINLRNQEQNWSRLIGYVPQNIFIIDGTIKDNILFGLKYGENNSNKLSEAIKASQLEAYINALPAGINAFTGDRGLRISGGERQRIGIARSIFKSGEILIMDEGTSALDNITENKLIRSITENSGFETIIFVAHRLSSIKGVDIIYIFDKGEIVASGDYDYLEKNSDIFRDLIAPDRVG